MATKPKEENKDVKPPVVETPPVVKEEKTTAKKETVEVPAETLKTILESLETLKASDKEKTETIAQLQAVADKGRMAHYEDKNKTGQILIQKAKVGFFNGFPIIAWSKAKDEVGFREGRLVVSQLINVFLDKGGESPEIEKDVEYLYWAQNTTTQEGEVVSKTSTGGAEYWTIEMPDGRKLTLDIRFINPF